MIAATNMLWYLSASVIFTVSTLDSICVLCSWRAYRGARPVRSGLSFRGRGIGRPGSHLSCGRFLGLIDDVVEAFLPEVDAFAAERVGGGGMEHP